MAYVKKESTGGKFFKWDAIGKEFEGRFVSLGQGEFKGRPTYHAVFRQLDGTIIQVNTPTILRRRLENEFRPGAQLKIIYVGDVKGRQATPAKDFEIYEDTDAAEPPAGAVVNADVDAAYAAVVKAKGEAAAKSIRAAVENIEKSPAGQAKMLLQAAGVAA